MFAERFARDGCLIVDRLFDPALIDSVRREYERQYGDLDPAGPPPHLNVGEGRLHLPLTLRGPLLDSHLCAHPLLLTMLGGIFDGPFVIDNVTIVTACPGAGEQRPHRDHPALFKRGAAFSASLPCYALTVSIPLVDLDAESGTTELFPGSMAQERGEEADPDPGEGMLPLVKRGGCFLMDYRLWHRGLANRSSRPRPILYLVYAREWFIDTVNFTKHARLVIDPAEVGSLPRELRLLFRRAAGKGLLDMTIKELGALPEGAE